MKVGLQIPDFTWPGGAARLGRELAAVARTADDAGFDFIGVMDHFFQIGMIGPPEQDMLEAYTTLGYLAACTSRARLLTLVTGVVYRHPGILAKIVTTLDVLSGGRAWLGIGAAWNEEESRGLGVPFPPMAERFERLEETLQICLQMWRGDESPFRGRHYQLDRPLNYPQALTPAASADHDRRLGRAQDAPARRAVRAGLQPVSRPGAGPQARGAAGALRGRGPRLRRDREDLVFRFDVGEQGREGGGVLDQLGPARRDWASRPRSAPSPMSGTSRPLEVMGSR